MSTIDYKPIANNGGANVESQAQYLIDLAGGGTLVNGYQTGLAKSQQVNKTLRQVSMIAAAVANVISNTLSQDVLDDGDLSALITALTNTLNAGSMKTGSGRLSVQSTTSIKLSPYNGNSLVINSQQVTIPDAGVFLGTTGLGVSTAYYAFARKFSQAVTGTANNGSGLIRLTLTNTTDLVTGNTLTVAGVLGTTEANGTWVITVIDGTHVDLVGSAFVHAWTSGGQATGMALLTGAIATGHSVQAATGIEIQTGNAALSLVGMLMTNGSTQFVDSASFIGLLNWSNRRSKAGETNTSSSSANTGASAEITTNARITFLSWADEAITALCDGAASESASVVTTLQLALDGTVAGSINSWSATAGASYNFESSYFKAVSEGVIHYTTPFATMASGTTTYGNMYNRLIVRG